MPFTEGALELSLEQSASVCEAAQGTHEKKADNRDEGNTVPASEEGGSPVRKKRKTVQFKPMVQCLEDDSSTCTPHSEEALSSSEVVEGARQVEGVREVENMEACVKRINSETNQLLHRWRETFTESESFEQFCPTRMEELLKEALAVEQSLIKQKEALKKRLERISQTLRLI